MADKLDKILEKLETIEGRLNKVESKAPASRSSEEPSIKQGLNAPLVLQSIKLIQNYDVISTDILEEKLKVDYDTAVKVITLLEKEGFVGDL